MKKIMITTVFALLCTGAVSFAQSNSSSTNKSNTNKAQGQSVDTPSPKNEKKSSNANKPNPTDQVAQQSSANDGSNRPGGETHENANDVGRYSNSDKADSKSMLNSQKAIEARRKNMTESDTTMKKGSGGARRNTKNHAGTTGNYRNTATRASKVPSAQ